MIGIHMQPDREHWTRHRLDYARPNRAASQDESEWKLQRESSGRHQRGQGSDCPATEEQPDWPCLAEAYRPKKCSKPEQRAFPYRAEDFGVPIFNLSWLGLTL
jgi:hypothetical protein